MILLFKDKDDREVHLSITPTKNGRAQLAFSVYASKLGAQTGRIVLHSISELSKEDVKSLRAGLPSPSESGLEPKGPKYGSHKT